MAIDRERSALLIVDVQNDFCEEGALAVPGGSEVVRPINSILPLFDNIVVSQDWHPAGHISFASSWPGKSLYDTVEADGIPQVLWPDHCIQGSPGAALHAGLESDRACLLLRKGFRPRLDSYSCFFENDRRTPTGLRGWLRERGVSAVHIAGLATDFCVLYTAIDALGLGYAVSVVSDAVRAVDQPAGSGARALAELRRKGASLASSAELLG